MVRTKLIAGNWERGHIAIKKSDEQSENTNITF